MALFFSTVVNKVDKKGRVSVPSAYRAALAESAVQGIIAIPSYKVQALLCGGMDWMQELMAVAKGKHDRFSDERSAMDMTLFSRAQPLALDGEGRIVLSEKLLRHTKIADRAAFAGVGDHFQIWEPSALDRHQAETAQAAAELGLTL